ncbi:MAG TPA: TonB-dependent receptor [Hyphomonadaceae bacterium]|nr:TonB-dependent receptor [Hyphomonadaceae bacterium]
MKRGRYHLFASVLAIAAATPALAQPAPQTTPAQPAAQDDTTNREVVVVTANKREETVQDVAVAVTAITSETKEEFGVISVTDLTNVTPGLSYTPGNERVTLRGIGRLSNSFGADPGVANYNDGVYTAFAVFAGKDPFLIDRVEVLRGPQGTLYGRNAIGGAINTISKRPSDDFSVDAVFGAGNYDYRKVGVAVSGPITDWLRYRAVGFKEVRDGIDPNYGENGEMVGWEINDEYLELQLEGDIGDRFSWWLKAADLYYDKAGPPGGRTATFTTAPYFITTNPAQQFLAGTSYNPAFPYTNNPAIISYTQGGNRHDNPFATNGEHAYNTNLQNTAQLPQYDEAIAEAVYSFDAFDLKYVGGYTFYDYQLFSDADGTPINSVTYNALPNLRPAAPGTPGSGPLTIRPAVTNVYKESRSAFSNEINLISTWDSPLQWIFGLYQYQDNQKQPGQAQYLRDEPLADTFFRSSGGAFGAPLGVIQNLDRRIQYFSNTSIQYAYGVYGQVDYQLNDQWKLTGGLRWSDDLKKSYEEAFLLSPYASNAPLVDFTPFVYYAPATPTAPTLAEGVDANGTAFRHLRGHWSAWTGGIGVEYTPNDDTLVFGKYSRGYKAGGFNNLGFAANPYTDSEFVDAYEAGWKQEWIDWGLTTNAALFYYNYTDAQAPLTVVRDFGLPTQTAFTAFLNVPKVETTGFELETTWNPIDPLIINFTYAYLNAEVKSDDLYVDSTKLASDPQRIRSVEGNQLGQSPKHKASLQASYQIDFEDGSYLLPTISYSWRDIFYDSFFNNPVEKSPSYDNLDARLNWYSSSGEIGITAWVRNALDEEQTTSITGTLRAADSILYSNPSFAPPRMFGVDLKLRFN